MELHPPQLVRVCLSGDGHACFEEMTYSECADRITSAPVDSEFLRAICAMPMGQRRRYHTASFKDAPTNYQVYTEKVHRASLWISAPDPARDHGDALRAFERYKEHIDIVGGAVMWQGDVLIEGDTLAHSLARAVALEYASKQAEYGIPEHHVAKAV